MFLGIPTAKAFSMQIPSIIPYGLINDQNEIQILNQSLELELHTNYSSYIENYHVKTKNNPANLIFKFQLTDLNHELQLSAVAFFINNTAISANSYILLKDGQRILNYKLQAPQNLSEFEVECRYLKTNTLENNNRSASYNFSNFSDNRSVTITLGENIALSDLNYEKLPDYKIIEDKIVIQNPNKEVLVIFSSKLTDIFSLSAQNLGFELYKINSLKNDSHKIADGAFNTAMEINQNETVGFEFTDARQINLLSIISGNLDQNQYFLNHRPKEIELTFDNNIKKVIFLSDLKGIQKVEFTPVLTKKVQLQVLSYWNGKLPQAKNYISEIEFGYKQVEKSDYKTNKPSLWQKLGKIFTLRFLKKEQNAAI